MALRSISQCSHFNISNGLSDFVMQKLRWVSFGNNRVLVWRTRCTLLSEFALEKSSKIRRHLIKARVELHQPSAEPEHCGYET